MRKTLTIDNDILAVLAKLQRDLNVPFKKLVNDTLRKGLESIVPRQNIASKKKYSTPSVAVGEIFVTNLDNISKVLATSEGNTHK